MEKVKLLKLEFDNRWPSVPENNDCFVTIGHNRDDAQKFELPVTEDLGQRLFEILIPEVTDYYAKMLNQLTGSDSPDIPTEQTQEPFLSPESDPEPEDD